MQREGGCMNQALLQVRVDKGLKEQVAAIYDAIGIDLPTAVRMFFKRTVMVGGLPFDGRLTVRDNAAQMAFSSMRQKVEAAQEEPSLDEINEYISSVRQSSKDAKTSLRPQA